MVFLVLDDFWDDLKKKGSELFDSFKEFASDNKHLLIPLVKSIISRIIPAANMISPIGGHMRSQDPYASDINYLKYLFGMGPAHPLGRY